MTGDKEAAQELLPDVSRETWERLDRLVALLHKWQPHINLIANSTLGTIWNRHIADSLQLAGLARDPWAHWLDLGSGGGFPGLVIAATIFDERQIQLVESDQRKCAFLREAARAMGVRVAIHNTRIEQITSMPAFPVDVVSARALAPTRRLLELAAPILKNGAQGLFPKGQDADVELTEARESWNIDYELVPSISDSRARVLVVSSLSPLYDPIPRR